jgi:hypothetical protein
MAWTSSSDVGPELHTGQVLIEEFEFIHGPERLRELLASPAARRFVEAGAKQTHDDCRKENARRLAQHAWAVSQLTGAGQSALCLSGGGIRSAAFGLGILQGLAAKGLLEQFHYLSTVSGGGYIASWLTAWRCRSGAALGDVIGRLRSRGPIDVTEPEPLQRLRFNQNFLTPKVGIGSADTWTALAMWVRNLLLNWVVFLPLLCALLLIPRVIEGFMIWARSQHDHAHSSLASLLHLYWPHPETAALADLGWWCWTDSVAALLVFGGLGASSMHRPAGGRTGMTQSWFLLIVLLPMMAGTILLTADVVSWIGHDNVLVRWVFLTGVIFVVARGFASLFMHARQPVQGAEAAASEPNWIAVALLEFVGWAIAGACTGLLIGLGVSIIEMADSAGDYWADWADPQPDIFRHVTIVGPPWVLLSFLIGDAVFVGVTSRSLYADQDREWLARSAGWFGAIALAYLVFFWVVLEGWSEISSWLAYPALVSSGLLSLGAALAPVTRATSAATAKERLPVTNLVAAMSAVFLLIGSAWLAYQSNKLVEFVWQLVLPHLDSLSDPVAITVKPFFVAAVAVALFLLSMLVSAFVNVNWFSLHALYRNRLVRTFLGASNVESTPELEHRDRFDGFSLRDNLSMAELRESIGRRVKGVTAPAAASAAADCTNDLHANNDRPPGGAADAAASSLWSNQSHRPGDHDQMSARLFPVLNMSLNVLATKNLAWQERKAEPFISTPLHTGGHLVGYRNSREYMGGKSATADQAKSGITLGTAMAISGAAVSPNWGYHSSPLTSFLMMLFNVRLGWWLGNPRHAKTWRYRGPLSSWKLFVQEALGQTDDDQPWLYLSDGGHFENLGLYEMIRRRCHTIVVSDAGADPNCTLEDLGNAVRKVWIDLGVKIEFQRILVRKRSEVASAGVYCAIGDIIYPGEAEVGQTDRRGRIVYFKPGFYGADEPADVRAYAAANAKFPHETTLNQWFGESQFESYRSLGAYVIEAICQTDARDATAPGAGEAVLSLEEFVDRAKRRLKNYQDDYQATVVDIRRPMKFAYPGSAKSAS